MTQDVLDHLSGYSEAARRSAQRTGQQRRCVGVVEGPAAEDADAPGAGVAIRHSPIAFRDRVLHLASVSLDLADAARTAAASRGMRALSTTDDDSAKIMLLLMDPMAHTASGKARLRYVVMPSTRMLNQFQPWFFGVAFPFCFKFGVGMPDMPTWSETPRHRRSGASPRVELGLWARIMTRRVESQLRRDWRFGFTVSSLLFQSAMNMARSMRLVSDPGDDEMAHVEKAKDLEEAAVSICNALHGKYKDPCGKHRDVNGDVNKLKFVSNLTPTAPKMVRSAQAIARKIPGTNEVRTLMRYDTHAARIAHGLSVFVTISPDERRSVKESGVRVCHAAVECGLSARNEVFVFVRVLPALADRTGGISGFLGRN